jgi:hypothetical protein
VWAVLHFIVSILKKDTKNGMNIYEKSDKCSDINKKMMSATNTNKLSEFKNEIVFMTKTLSVMVDKIQPALGLQNTINSSKDEIFNAFNPHCEISNAVQTKATGVVITLPAIVPEKIFF